MYGGFYVCIDSITKIGCLTKRETADLILCTLFMALLLQYLVSHSLLAIAKRE